MAKKELKEQLKSYEGYINDIPLVIDPCKMCKVYKEHNGYDAGDRLVNNEWWKGICDECCWFYVSKFEIGVSDNSCRTCKNYDKITSVADYQQSSNMKRYSMLTQTEEKLKKARNIIKHLLIMLHEKELYGVYVSIAQDFMAEVEEEDADKTEESQDL